MRVILLMKILSGAFSRSRSLPNVSMKINMIASRADPTSGAFFVVTLTPVGAGRYPGRTLLINERENVVRIGYAISQCRSLNNAKLNGFEFSILCMFAVIMCARYTSRLPTDIARHWIVLSISVLIVRTKEEE